MNKFVIISEQSNGSNLLRTSLANHPRITVLGELFVRNGEYKNNIEVENLKRLLKQVPWYYYHEYTRYKLPVRFITCLAQLAANSDYFGFKLMLRQHDVLCEKLISSREWKKIVLTRPNLLAVYASRKHARLTGDGFLLKDQDKIRRIKIEFVSNEFEKFMKARSKRREKLNEMLARHSADHLYIEYPAITRPACLNKVFEFLEIDISELPRADTRKRNDNNILERFSNPELVADYLDSIDRNEWVFENATEY